MYLIDSAVRGAGTLGSENDVTRGCAVAGRTGGTDPGYVPGGLNMSASISRDTSRAAAALREFTSGSCTAAGGSTLGSLGGSTSGCGICVDRVGDCDVNLDSRVRAFVWPSASDEPWSTKTS